MEHDNKTLVMDTSYMKKGQECKEEEKQFRDQGFTWFHQDGDYCNYIYEDTEDP